VADSDVSGLRLELKFVSDFEMKLRYVKDVGLGEFPRPRIIARVVTFRQSCRVALEQVHGLGGERQEQWEEADREGWEAGFRVHTDLPVTV
jgi:hypothetical protein